MQKIEENLTYFYSIGSIQAKKLLKKLIELKLINSDKNYTLSDLRRILSKKEIFDELSIATKTDLKYNPLRVIPRPIIKFINDEIQKIFSALNIQYDICGSYIRGKSTSGDIDMVVNTDDLSRLIRLKKISEYKNIIDKLNESNIKFHEPFANGNDKIATLIEVDLIKSKLVKEYPEFKKLFKCTSSCKVNVKIDIFLSNTEDYIFAKMFAIGSGSFNIRMRSVAKKKGYLLNNHGLWKKTSVNILEKMPIKTEKEIFDFLNIKYKQPSERIK